MTHRTPALLVASIALLACGARTTEDLVDGGRGAGSSSGGGSGGSSGSGSGSSSGAPGPGDASPVQDAIAFEDVVQPVVCSTMGGGSGGNGSCSIMQGKSCSDGNTYNIECDCPSATCSCTQSGPNGGSSGAGISFSGCPSCDPGSVPWSACGFPGQ